MIDIIKKYYIYIIIGVMILVSLAFSLDFSTSEGNEVELPEYEQDVYNSFIYVDIRGEVVNPGVYKVDDNTRLFQLIKKAGGLTLEADQLAINQSIMLTDEMYVYVPNINEKTEQNKTDSNSTIVNINTATQTELESLPGIGPSTAFKIIDYRENISQFNTIADIMNVPGIGESTYNEIKDLITV